MRTKIVLMLVGTLVFGAVAFGYVYWRAEGPPAAQAPGTALAFHRPGQLMFAIDTGADEGRVAAVTPSGLPAVSDLRCQRFHTSAGVTVCVLPVVGLVPTARVRVLDRDQREIRLVNASGTVSRARVSPSGQVVAWTTFVTGDSYAVAGFSTRTGILDLRSGRLIINMETIQLYLDGKRHHSPDVNYWGVTFAKDDNLFYATVATGGKTYLIEGDLSNWRARDLRQNVECPSLSPDGKRIAFKKRVSDGDRPWRLAVLELATGREVELPGTDGIDDQAIWLDDQRVGYGMAGKVWAAPADGSAAPVVLAENATSPAMM